MIVAAYILPWLTGAIWLIWLDSFQQRPINFPKVIGYGYFIGYFICALSIYGTYILTNSLSGSLIFYVLLFLTVIGLIFTWLRLRNNSVQPIQPMQPLSWSYKGLLLLVFIFIALHLTFSIYELINHPQPPWDAWTTWTYRAKIWFFNNELSSFTDARHWLNSSQLNIYTISAYNYPSVVSLIQLWPVLVYGQWSDSLALFPGLLAGVALCFALYGQVQSSGGSVLLSTIAVYLLISMPLLDAHMAMPGYADIWMSGFVGLGLISLLQWLQNRTLIPLLLGLGLLIMALFIKREGSVWLVVGIVFIIMQLLSWKLIISAIALCGIAVFSGHSLLTIPGIGMAGFSDGIFYIPGIGTFMFQPRNVSAAVFNNLFVYDNWHLLYVFLAALFLITLFSNTYQARKAFISLFVLVAAVIGTIFYLSSESSWAQNSTALARLLLHPLPVWVYLLFLGWKTNSPEEQEGQQA
jgi:hypothetical protein